MAPSPAADIIRQLAAASDVPFISSHRRHPRRPVPCNASANVAVNARKAVRLGLPSSDRLGPQTLNLLKECQLSVRQTNPRQYYADIPQLSGVEVWFQRPNDIVRRLLSGHLDLGIVGLDKFLEIGQNDENLVIVHDALRYGDCQLSLAIPKDGIFAHVNSVDELAQITQWSEERPFRILTKYAYLAAKFVKDIGLKYATFSTADGTMEVAPTMGIVDGIVDIVSSGTTLRENNLKELDGGVVLKSQAVLVASRKSLVQRNDALDITHEMLERLEAHIRALDQFMVTANVRGCSKEEVAERVLDQPTLSGLQGPTISRVFDKDHGNGSTGYFAVVICVPKKALYKAVRELRDIGGSGVLVSPLTYIFDEETPRWPILLGKLGK